MRGKPVRALIIISMILGLRGVIPVARAGPGDPPELLNDVFIAPDLPAGKMSIAGSQSITPGYYQTSEYMAGSVAVGIVLLQCDGSMDPCTESWTPEEKQLVYNKIVAATNWWASLEPRAHLSFVFDDHFTNPLPTRVEPIARPYTDMQYWVADAMGALGYDALSYLTRARDYTNHLRATHHTDWAFTIFVVDSSNDSDGRFSGGGVTAFACLGGPFLVMTYTNSSYGPDNMDMVAAHEIGHIFYALDQYLDALQRCTNRSGYLSVENQNSQYGSCASSVSSIMLNPMVGYTYKAIDPYAAGQIGWRDSDGDGILDPLDTELPVSITAISQNGSRVIVSGTAEIIPYPSPTRPNVTINALTGAQYRFDKGDWQQTAANDGAFGGTAEGYYLVASLAPGRHILEVAARDSAGNVSAIYATGVITVLDAIDGGLITQLYPSGDQYTGVKFAMSGVALELTSGIVAGVQYRADGGSWQPAQAQDGAFDSSDEPFTLSVDSLPAGTHLIEARATDVNGKTEINVASQRVAVKMFTTFLPAVIR